MAQLRATIHFNTKQEKKNSSHHHTSPLPPDENDCVILDNNDNRNDNDHNNTISSNESEGILGEGDIEDDNIVAKTITTNEEIEAYFRTCERMLQEESIAIEDENISNLIFLQEEDIFDLVGETEHPANNVDAKWAIKDLFKPLDIP